MSGRGVLAAGIALLAAVIAVAVFDLMRGSVPASPDEIRTAVATSRAECRSLVRDRLRDSIARNGAISRRQLDTISHMECTVSGPQYEAIGR